MKSAKVRGVFRLSVVAGALFAAGFSSSTLARDVDLLGGTNYSGSAKYYYLGLVAPIQNESLDQDGFVLRLWAAYKNYDYTTRLPGGPNGNKTTIDVNGPQFEGAIGYQHYFSKESRVTGYVGLAHRNLNQKPDDPGSSNTVDKNNGIRFQLEGTTRSGDFGVSAIGSYVTGFKDLWARVRPAYYLGDSLNIGPEFVVMHGSEYSKQQLGVFVEGIRLEKNASIGLKLGAENNSRNGPNNGTKPYGGISFHVRF